MPRAVTAVDTGPGFARYVLGQREEFTVLAVTFSLVPEAGAGGDNFAWLDCRDPSGGIIVLQPLAPGDGANMFYSLAFGSEPFLAESGTPTFWPQESNGFGFQYVSQRLTPVTLSGKCSLNVYKTVGSESPPTDPVTAISPDYSIPDLHLWVEDRSGRRELPANSPPLLTHIAA